MSGAGVAVFVRSKGTSRSKIHPSLRVGYRKSHAASFVAVVVLASSVLEAVAVRDKYASMVDFAHTQDQSLRKVALSNATSRIRTAAAAATASQQEDMAIEGGKNTDEAHVTNSTGLAEVEAAVLATQLNVSMLETSAVSAVNQAEARLVAEVEEAGGDDFRSSPYIIMLGAAIGLIAVLLCCLAYLTARLSAIMKASEDAFVEGMWDAKEDDEHRREITEIEILASKIEGQVQKFPRTALYAYFTGVQERFIAVVPAPESHGHHGKRSVLQRWRAAHLAWWDSKEAHHHGAEPKDSVPLLRVAKVHLLAGTAGDDANVRIVVTYRQPGWGEVDDLFQLVFQMPSRSAAERFSRDLREIIVTIRRSGSGRSGRAGTL